MLGFSLLSLLVIALLINGPICRTVVASQLKKTLHNLYLTGNFQVSGTLLSGLEIDNVELSGTQHIESVTIRKILLDYHLMPLINGQWGEGIVKIHLHDMDVTLNSTPNFPKDPDIEAAKSTKKDSHQSVWQNLDRLLENDLLFENLNVTINSSEQPIASLANLSLTLKNGSGSISLQRLFYPEDQTITNLNASLDSSGEKLLQINTLELAEELELIQFTLLTPKSDNATLPALSGQLRLVDGKIDLTTSNSNSITATLGTPPIDLSRLSHWLAPDLSVSGSLTELSASVSPPFAVRFTTKNLTYRNLTTEILTASAEYQNGQIHIKSLAASIGNNSLTSHGTYHPKSHQLSAAIELSAPQLRQLSTELGGSLNGNINLQLAEQSFAGTTATLSAANLTFQNYLVSHSTINATTTPDGHLTFDLSAQLDPESANQFSATGSIDPNNQILTAKPVITFNDLSQLHTPFTLNGTLIATAEFKANPHSLLSAASSGTATDLDYNGTRVPIAKLSAKTTAPDQLDFDLHASLDEDTSSQLSSTGSFNIKSKNYTARAQASLDNFSAIQPFFTKLTPVGMAELAWSGTGSLQTATHNGTAHLTQFKFQLDDQPPVQGKLDLDYSPDSFHLTNLLLKTTDISITGAAHLALQRLTLDDLQFFKNDTPIAHADISLPLDLQELSGIEDFLSQPGEISIALDSNQLNLDELLSLLGQPKSLSATVDSNISITGTLDRPLGNGHLTLLQLRDPAATDLAPADLVLDFKLAEERLTLNGTLSHPEIEPITIKGSTPLHMDSLDQLADQSIDLELILPRTDLTLAEIYLPNLTTATGSIEAKLKATGTFDQPNLTGDIRIAAPLLKWKEQKIPTLTDLDIGIHLEGTQINVESFTGYLAGGKLTLTGNANIDSLTNPILNLALIAEQALVFRDDSVSLRANGNLNLTGPLQTAALDGTIAITQSRFFKEIEILPIGLPRSAPTPAAPKAPSFDSPKKIGLNIPPFNDWTVNVAVTTADPFLVRSNLAKADIISAIKITGTLGDPIPNGTVSILNGTATLPFSEMKTSEGTLTFSEATRFDPNINFKAVSKVQNYNLNLIAYGKLSDPKTLITSDPPLPESEVVSLLATGAKSSDLSSGEVIAGDAALLLFDKLRRKYTKGTPIERTPRSLRELLSFRAGQIDPRTGKRAASASLEVTENIYLLGNVDVEGEYRGLLKLIFRFN